ncbi:MAG TPA: 50S ribosomal protein L23 [Patescibacteria group bacterium]|nr:50S ribosomal protein L23 [Patescibacteria group bacterium]
MSIIDRIKGKKDEAPKKASKKSPKKQEDVLSMVQEETPTAEKTETVLKEDTGRAHHILLNYHLSEKSNLLSTFGRYVFKVSRHANKLEVRKAVEKVYDVHVVSVNIVRSRGKVRRSGRVVGKTSDWKKAYVTLKEGEKISGLAEGV